LIRTGARRNPVACGKNQKSAMEKADVPPLSQGWLNRASGSTASTNIVAKIHRGEHF